MAKLYFYYGAMGSCKTATLLTTAYNYREKGMHPLILTSSVDTRSGTNKVQSRIEGLECEANSVTGADNLYNMVRDSLSHHAKEKIDVVLCDELQFFSEEQVEQLTDIVDILNIPVICYGLRADFRMKFFPGSKRLMELADEIHELKTMCICGSKATVNVRFDNGKIVSEGEQIQIGGNSTYTSMCRKCYKARLKKDS